MLLPVKTNDIVKKGDRRYVVKGVQLTPSGVVLEMHPIESSSVIVHASEVSLEEKSEVVRRAKSVGVKALQAQRNNRQHSQKSLRLPDGMTLEEATAILKKYAQRER